MRDNGTNPADRRPRDDRLPSHCVPCVRPLENPRATRARRGEPLRLRHPPDHHRWHSLGPLDEPDTNRMTPWRTERGNRGGAGRVARCRRRRPLSPTAGGEAGLVPRCRYRSERIWIRRVRRRHPDRLTPNPQRPSRLRRDATRPATALPGGTPDQGNDPSEGRRNGNRFITGAALALGPSRPGGHDRPDPTGRTDALTIPDPAADRRWHNLGALHHRPQPLDEPDGDRETHSYMECGAGGGTDRRHRRSGPLPAEHQRQGPVSPGSPRRRPYTRDGVPAHRGRSDG